MSCPCCGGALPLAGGERYEVANEEVNFPHRFLADALRCWELVADEAAGNHPFYPNVFHYPPGGDEGDLVPNTDDDAVEAYLHDEGGDEGGDDEADDEAFDEEDH